MGPSHSNRQTNVNVLSRQAGARGDREKVSLPSATGGDGQSPFRVGTGGLMVVVVPEQLKAACGRRGWSLTDLAKRAGISYPTLRSTLQGKCVRPRTAWKLARALAAGDNPAEYDCLLPPVWP